VQHLTWLIDNHPKRSIHEFISLHKADDAYKKARLCWLRQVRENPDDVTILCHAAHFFTPLALDDAARFLHRAAELDCFNDDMPRQLSFVYSLMAGHFSPRKNKLLAHKSVEQLKIAIERYAVPSKLDDESYLLPYFSMVVEDTARVALNLNAIEDAKDLGQILMNHRSINASRCPLLVGLHSEGTYQLSNYRGHAILGQAAAASGDVELAKEHLSQMMRFPINSHAEYGLAEQLLELGESEIVVQYIEHCWNGFDRDSKGVSDPKHAESMKKWLASWLKQIKRQSAIKV